MPRRSWIPEEDDILREHGERNWDRIEKNSGLDRSAQSCRQRWQKFLKFGPKESDISTEEEELLIHLHTMMGNRWAKMAEHFPGRTETELKDIWDARRRKRSLDLDQKNQQIDARSPRRCGADLLEIPAFITLCFLANDAQACYARMFSGSRMPDLRFQPEASIEAVSVSFLRLGSDRKSFLRFRSGIEAKLRSLVPLNLNLPSAESPDRRFVVGHALSLKKARSLIRPSLVSAARNRGVDLVPVDPWRPLAEQGPFDCVIHKFHSVGWKAQLAYFAAKNPGVPIVDQPLAIELLHDRNTMLQLVSKLDVPHGTENFGVPNKAADLRFPIIAHPLVSDGIAKSHGMSLVYQLGDLRMIKPPLLLLEFVNHGGVFFKVNVAGNYVRCARRQSLPDVPAEQTHSVASDTLSLASNPEVVEWAELPPSSFVKKIAMGLRRATGLRLFSFDMIRPADARHHYLITNINYFPDYSKIPGYEEFVTEFFWDMVHQNGESAASSSLSTKV